MAKQIKGNEIIQDNWASNAILSAEQLKQAYSDLDKMMLKIIEHGKAVSKGVTIGSVAEIKKVTEAYNQTNAATKAAIQLDKQLRDADDEVVKGKLRLQEVTATQRKLLKEEIALEDKQIGTLKKLAIENARLRREREGLNLKTKDGAARLKEINVQLDKNNALIKESADLQKKQSLNVGNYKSAINGLNGALMQLGIGLSVFTLMRDAFNTVKDFDKATQSLSAITGATGSDLENLKVKVQELSDTMKISAVDSTKLFEIVGSQMPQLLKDAAGLQEVAESAVTLSKASGDTVEESTLALANVMNQFSLGAEEAERAMNVLAAGSLVGSAGITDVSESMKNFGSVAAGANVSVEESVALIEVLGKFGLVGAEAGTKLRGSLLKLQQAGLGYASGQFEINDALEEAKAKFDSLNSAIERDAFLQKTFGAENISTGKILLSNIGLFEEYTKGVTGTSTATDQAAINSDTLATVIKELQAAWDNLVIKWMSGNNTLGVVKDVLRFVAENLETIVSIAVRGAAAWAAYRLALLLFNKEGTGVIQVLKQMVKPLEKVDDSLEDVDDATKKVDASTKKAKISFAGWASIVAVALPLVIELGMAIYDAVNETTALDRVTEKLNARMDEEKAAMDVLLVQIRATTAGSKERQQVIDQINSKYGTTLQNLKDETMFMTQLAYAYQKVVTQMERKINAQLNEEELTELFKARRAFEKLIAEEGEEGFWNSDRIALLNEGLGKTNDQIAELQKKMVALNRDIGQAGKAKMELPFDRLGKSAGKAGDEVKDLRTGVDRLVKSAQGFTDADLKAWRELIQILGGGIQGDEFDPKDKGLWASIAEQGIKLTDDLLKKEQQALEQRKKMYQESLDLLKKLTEQQIAQYDLRIEKEKESVEASKNTIDYLREQAAAGNTDAAEAIKAEEIAQSRQLLEIERLERKKRNLLIVTTGLEAVSQKINSGDSNAFKNVGQEIADFLAKLPKFYKGTEGTVAEALGKPHLNTAQDGYLSRLDGKEMVLTGDKVATLRAAGLNTTSEIANAAMAYSSGFMPGRSGSSQDSIIASKLDAVENAIKNIQYPEHDIRWNDFDKSIVHTVKVGTKLERNHYKKGGLFS